MNIIHEEDHAGKRILALGTFDGVHLGHRKLLSEGKNWARVHGALLRVCTFDRHPLELLRPEAAPCMLTNLAEKAERMASCGADELRVFAFSREMAEKTPEAFLSMLRRETELQAVVAGWNYTFGRFGAGNVEALRQDGEKYGYEVIIVPPVTLPDGMGISSTAIRTALQKGELSLANQMLGAPYSLTGPVVDGKHLGRTLGFPTANVQVEKSKQLPAFGVYLCRIHLRQQSTAAAACNADSRSDEGFYVKSWNGVVNVGLQPTLPSGKVTVEAHILQDHPDLYGQMLTVELLERLRGEQRFHSAEELKLQLQKDREEARRYFEGE